MQKEPAPVKATPVIPVLVAVGAVSVIGLLILVLAATRMARDLREVEWVASVVAPQSVGEGEEFAIIVTVRAPTVGSILEGVNLPQTYLEGVEIISSEPPWTDVWEDEYEDTQYDYSLPVAPGGTIVVLRARAIAEGTFEGLVYVQVDGDYGWDSYDLKTEVKQSAANAVRKQSGASMVIRADPQMGYPSFGGTTYGLLQQE